MPNTNGMRYPMTALKAFEFNGQTYQQYQVFDAVNIATYNGLRAEGFAAYGDLHNAGHELSQLPSQALGAESVNPTLGAKELNPPVVGKTGAKSKAKQELDPKDDPTHPEYVAGRNRTVTGGVDATSDSAKSQSQAEVPVEGGGSLGSVPPEIPELNKTNPNVNEVATTAPGSTLGVENTVIDATKPGSIAPVSKDAPDTDNTKTTSSDEGKLKATVKSADTSTTETKSADNVIKRTRS